MFYTLSKHTPNGRTNYDQLGIVVADSLELAAAKVHLAIVCSVRPPESGCVFAYLQGDHILEEMSEITEPIVQRETLDVSKEFTDLICKQRSET